IELGAGAAGARQVGARHVAGDLLAVGGDGILEVEDQPVGTEGGSLGELALRIGGNEQEGTHACSWNHVFVMVFRTARVPRAHDHEARGTRAVRKSMKDGRAEGRETYSSPWVSCASGPGGCTGRRSRRAD